MAGWDYYYYFIVKKLLYISLRGDYHSRQYKIVGPLYWWGVAVVLVEPPPDSRNGL